METQSAVLFKDRFKLSSARRWIRKHGFKTSNMDDTTESFRFRQEDPDLFAHGTFRNKYIDDSVMLVLAKRKSNQSVIICPRTGLKWDGFRWTK